MMSPLLRCVVGRTRLIDVGDRTPRRQPRPRQSRRDRWPASHGGRHRPRHLPATTRTGGGNGEASSAGRRRSCVHADEATLHVDQRAARVAGIDRRIRLDEELVVVRPARHARQRRDDAAGDCLADAEGIADGKHEIAHLHRIGIGELDGRQVAPDVADDAQDREIGALVLQHDLGIELAAIGERHTDLIGKLNDVIVGDDQAIGADDDPGAERALHALAGPATEGVAEELAEEGIGEEGRDLALDGARGIDVDDGRRHALDHRRERKLHLGRARRHLTFLGLRNRGETQHKRNAQQYPADHSHLVPDSS